MAEESLIEGEDENILYDLLVITEWPPETDTQVSSTHLGLSVCLFLERALLESHSDDSLALLKAT